MSSPNQTESNNAAEAGPAERRRNLRFPFSAAVELVETKSGSKLIGRTSDLGLGGCYIDTLTPLPVDTEAKVRILRDNESFEAQVRVVYSSSGMGMGLAFVSAQPKQIRIFQRWLQELSGQSVPPPEVPTEDEPETVPSEKTQSLLRNAVLSDLIMTLMQKQVLTEREGRDLLKKLFV
jgi:hypothetical protein